MTTDSTTAAAVKKPISRARHWILIGLAAAMLVVTVKAAGIFFLSGDARKLQMAVDSGGDDVFSTRIQFSVGPGIIGLAWSASFFIDDVPSEARHALGTLQEASVGIYELAGNPSVEQRAGMMTRANEKLEREGWQRIVAVNDHSDTVPIYLPEAEDIADELRICVTVWTGREVVVVSVIVEPEELLEIVHQHRGFMDQVFPQLERSRA